jgi:hypothetical protein
MAYMARLNPGERTFIDVSKIKALGMRITSFSITRGSKGIILKEPIFLRPTIIDPIFEARVIHFIYRRGIKTKLIAIIRYYTKLGLLEFIDSHNSNQLHDVMVYIGDDIDGHDTFCTNLIASSYYKGR